MLGLFLFHQTQNRHPKNLICIDKIGSSIVRPQELKRKYFYWFNSW